jgi:hypothetical protein
MIFETLILPSQESGSKMDFSRFTTAFFAVVNLNLLQKKNHWVA